MTNMTHYPQWGMRTTSRGNVLVIVTVLMVFLLGFLGISTYTGLTSYLQNELQSAVSAAAGTGASAMYNGFDGSNFLSTSATAQQAAQSTFNTIVAEHPALSGFGVTLSSPPAVNAASGIVRVDAELSIPTGFLAMIGISSYEINAQSVARYAWRLVPSADTTINTKTGPYFRTIALDPPLIDGPGPDISFETQVSGGGLHGVLLEICSNNKCSDLGHAARAIPGKGRMTERNYPGVGARRVMYGSFVVDFGATGAGTYNQDVKKGAYLRIVDDGIHDYLVPGTWERGIELDPAPTMVQAALIGKYAVYCQNETSCTAPAGFQFDQPPVF